MDIHQAQSQFRNLIQGVDHQHLPGFLRWIKENIDDSLTDACASDENAIMEQIREDIREALPQSATLPSENIVLPTKGECADFEAANTVHMDGFLYDDDIVDELCDAGKMSRNYCNNCGSHQVTPLNYISHSTSKTQLQFIFQHLLQNLQGKHVLDIGSRTGAVLYGAYLYSECSAIMGVEISEEFCQLQNSIVSRYKMNDRIQVLCADICSRPDLLLAADVIVMHNVFEFFAPEDVQVRIWKFLNDHMKKSGAFLVVSPSLETSLKDLNTGINLSTWVRKLDISKMLATANLHLFGNEGSEDSDLDDIHLYQIL